MTTAKLHKIIKSQLSAMLEANNVEYIADWQNFNDDRAQLQCSIDLSATEPLKNNTASAVFTFKIYVPENIFTKTEIEDITAKIFKAIETNIVATEGEDVIIYNVNWQSTPPASNDGVKIVFETNYTAMVQY